VNQSMVDYSKWDKLEESDSDSSDDDEMSPEVQKFDQPQQVTWGPNGVELTPQEPKTPQDPTMQLTKPDSAQAMDISDERGSSSQRSSTSHPLHWDANSLGPAVANGGIVGERYVWSQTAEEVQVHVIVPSTTAAKAVAIKVTENRLCLKEQHGTVQWLAGEWEFPIFPEEDVDWEVKELCGRRVVRILVRKKPPVMGGLRVWWSRVLKGEPQIDVAKIEGRSQKDPHAFEKAWKEAHEQFREKIKGRQPIPINC